MTAAYPTESLKAHPPFFYPDYRSTVKRSPSRRLVLIPPHALRAHRPGLRPRERARSTTPTSRASMPASRSASASSSRAACSTRTAGRCRTRWSRSGRPTPPAATSTSDRPAPRAARPELLRRRPLRHRRRRPLPLHHDQARRLSLAQPPQCLAAGAHPFLAVRADLPDAAGHADVFSRRSAARRSTRSSTRLPDASARERLISSFDLETTEPEWALGYRFDIVLRGRDATPIEEPHHG